MNIKKNLEQAYNFFQQNNLDAAELLLNKILIKYPNNLDALNNLSLIKIRKNLTDDAISLLKKSLEINPQLNNLKNLCFLYSQQKLWTNILNIYDQYIKKIKYDYQLEILKASALREIGKKEDAVSLLEKLLDEKKDDINIYISYIYTLNYFNAYEKAEKIGNQAISKFPESFIINFNHGITYSNLEQPIKAITYLNKAKNLAKNENLFDLWITLSAQYIKTHQIEEAQFFIDKCKEINQNNLIVKYQEASLKTQSGDILGAKEKLEEVLREDQNHTEANYLLGLVFLKLCHYKQAMDHYRFRTKRIKEPFGYFDDFEHIQINKRSKLIIHWEQGIGDQIIIFRIMNELIDRVDEITYISKEKILSTFKKNFPQIKYIEASKSKEWLSKLEDHDSHIKLNLLSIMKYIDDFPKAISKSKHWIPNKIKKDIYLKKYKTKRKLIGLSWKSTNLQIGYDKSFSLKELIELLKDSDYEFINLQYGEVKEEIDEIKKLFNVNIQYIDELDYFNDIDGLGALIAICDEVITCSNITTHIAGSLGVSTRLLLSKDRGKLWYWFDQTNKNTSTWYPSVKIYNQIEYGKWTDAMILLKNELKK